MALVRVAAFVGAGALGLLGLPGCSAGHDQSTESPADAVDGERSRGSDGVREGSAQSGAYASELARMLGQGEAKSILIVGDSITAGYRCDGWGEETDRIIYQGVEGFFYETAPSVRCWANEFRQLAAERGVEDFVNAGIGGARMAWLAGGPDAWLGSGADVIVVMLGTNDAVFSPIEEFRANCEAGLSAAAARCALLVVMSPPDNWRADGRGRYGMDVVDQVVAEVCASHGWCHLSMLDVTSPDDGTLSADNIHPSSDGSLAIWQKMRSELGI